MKLTKKLTNADVEKFYQKVITKIAPKAKLDLEETKFVLKACFKEVGTNTRFTADYTKKFLIHKSGSIVGALKSSDLNDNHERVFVLIRLCLSKTQLPYQCVGYGKRKGLGYSICREKYASNVLSSINGFITYRLKS